MVLRSTEQAHRLQFMKSELKTLLSLLVGDDDVLSRSSFNRLSFLIHGGPSQVARAADLASLCPMFGRGDSVSVDDVHVRWVVCVTVSPRNVHTLTSSACLICVCVCGFFLSLCLSLSVSLCLSLSLSLSLSVSLSLSLSMCFPPRVPCVFTLQAWLKDNLGVNEIAYPPSGSSSSAGTAHSPSRPTAGAGTAHSLSPIISPIIVSSVHKSTVFKTAAPRAHALSVPPGGADSQLSVLPDATVEHCNDAFIYLLCPLRSVSIVASHNCTVVVGATAGVLSVEVCNGVRVVAASALVRIVNCVDSLFQLHTPHAPVIAGDCRGITLSPHCAQYNGLRHHVAAAGLTAPSTAASGPGAGAGAGHSHGAGRRAGSGAGAAAPGGAGAGASSLTTNIWNSPHVICADVDTPSSTAEVDRPSPYQLLDPGRFFTLIVPLPGSPSPGKIEPVGAFEVADVVLCVWFFCSLCLQLFWLPHLDACPPRPRPRPRPRPPVPFTASTCLCVCLCACVRPRRRRRRCTRSFCRCRLRTRPPSRKSATAFANCVR